MTTHCLGCLLFLTPCAAALADRLILERDNTVINQSTVIKPGSVTLVDIDDNGAVQIVGDNLIIDFAGFTLVGSPDTADPDAYVGRGIVIRGKGVTVKNAVVRGYKVGIYAENSEGVRLENCDVSRNYRQRLKSTPQAEHLDDWLYGHENDQNEWLRYGSGIYFFNCPKAWVQNCRSRNGQNGICLVRCDESVIIDNDMSFMSGWGLAMWRSSRCEISHNKFDWCIRGYSHGVYSRGQDSAGILVYEQCSDNVFAYNSATHGGDGFFLYAGNETLNKTGTGGCNRNIIYKNDFSHAAANGIEATFSEGNGFFANKLVDCEHGIWAGYSIRSVFDANEISDCKFGISIEHGFQNAMHWNLISKCNVGIHLWWDKDEDLLNSVYGRAHDRCLSSKNGIVENHFIDCRTGIRMRDDQDSGANLNTFERVATTLEIRGNSTGFKADGNTWGEGSVALDPGVETTIPNPQDMSFVSDDLEADRKEVVDAAAEAVRIKHPIHGSQDAFIKPGTPRGRQHIFVDEWGPYDFSGLKVYPTYVVAGSTASIQVLGPSLTYSTVDPSSSSFDFRVLAIPNEGQTPAVVNILSRQKNTVTSFNLPVIMGDQKFAVRGVLSTLNWNVKHFTWSEANDPRTKQSEWEELLTGQPFCEKSTDLLDFKWGGGGACEGGPVDHFGTMATARFTLPEGRWRIKTISDDGIRVWLNGMRVIDEWTWHGPTEYSAEFDATVDVYDLRVEHFEIDGWAQLQLFIEPVAPIKP